MIREITPSDSIPYRALRTLGLDLHPEAFGTGADAWHNTTDEKVKALLAKKDDSFVLGAFQGEDLVGVIGVQREQKHSVRHKGTIWGFFVKPEARGNGIGAALMDALIARVKKEKLFLYVRAVVTVSPLNASRIFQKKGFTQYGKEPRGIKSGEALFDQEYWKLDI